ncbi:MAG: dihydrolipoamide acetyltransferase family protein [Anaerolineaceae bacterium]|nr:dihydrolipoamide acetyltransferase family protein [Anaerolineaceae bacterium]MDE0329085.1 dihydrolipoamide acetyltransferase family protein [Anaerolineaceae bacterium]
MPTTLQMPKLGESVIEGTVSRWLKREGDPVDEYEPLLEIITDKVDTEIPSPAAGVLLRIHVGEGETVAVGTPLALIGDAGEEVEARQSARAAGSGRHSPAVARLLAEHQLDAAAVRGSGREGRITRKDVEAHLASRQQATAPAESTTPGELLPLTPMRRRIAQQMVASVQTAPQVTAVYEADMGAVLAQRETLRAEHPGLRFTPVAWIVAATARALVEHPTLNAEWRADGIFLHHERHVGLAVALEEGLIVPVIRHADRLALPDLARAIADLATRARAGQLRPDEARGGTFTISNYGAGGCLVGTPIINPPQAAILGVGALQQRPVVREGALVARPMCYFSLTFDHRVLDGALADAFMRCMMGGLESGMDADREKQDR